MHEQQATRIICGQCRQPVRPREGRTPAPGMAGWDDWVHMDGTARCPQGSKDALRHLMALFARCLVVVALALVACSSGDGDAADPYETYLANAPEMPADWAGEWPLSREDAQARAVAGCGQDWAPGTIDAALQEAYQPAC